MNGIAIGMVQPLWTRLSKPFDEYTKDQTLKSGLASAWAELGFIDVELITTAALRFRRVVDGYCWLV